MKKLLICLAACLALGAAAPILRAAAESPAYIVGLSDAWDDTVHSFSQGELTELAPEQGIYLARNAGTVAALCEAGMLEYAEPDCKVRLLGQVSDTLYPEQWNLEAMQVSALWDAGLFGAGARIAVIDSGLYSGHDDLAGANILPGVNFLNGTDDLTDESGHGTFVTGIIAAVRDNGIGIAGIADQVEILPLKCFDDKEETNISYILSAIYAAVDDLDCDVINLSLGLAKDMQSFRQAIDYAAEQGVIIVSSVGNYGGETLMYPAAYDNVIGVGAVDEQNALCAFSQRNESVFVAAPGAGLCSLGNSAPNAYMTGSGTSFATPHVTALAAVAKSVDPEMSVQEFQALLAASAVDQGQPGYDMSYGYGTLDAAAFAALLLPSTPEDRSYQHASVQIGQTLEYDLSTLLPASADCTVIASNAAGEIRAEGGVLYYTPAPSDTYKSVRILLSGTSAAQADSAWGCLTISVLEADAAPDPGFSDLTGHWSYPYAARAVADGLFSGISETAFAPDKGMTRAMLVTVLARLAGADLTDTPDTGFSDVPAQKWYAPAVAWASAQGLVTGVGGGLFLPEQEVSRQELATILYRYAQWQGLETASASPVLLQSYTDADTAAAWAAEGISWALAQGILSGDSDTTLSPARSVTRAEAAVLLLRTTATLGG